METFFLHFLFAHKILAYFLIFLGLVAEGESILFLAAFLAHLGFLKLTDLMPIAFLGVAAGDYLWYLIGTRLVESNGRIRKWVEKAVKPLEKTLIKKPQRAIITAKFVYGLNRATLLKFGMLKFQKFHFLRIDWIAIAIWITIIGGLAYVFSSSLTVLRHYFRYFEIILLIALIGFFAIEKLARYALERGSLKDEEII